jgi:hypothetical protein
MPMTGDFRVEKTAVGTSSWSTAIGRFPNTVSAKVMAIAIGDGREVYPVGDISDRVDAWDGGLGEFVHGNPRLLFHLHAGFLQAKTVT